VLVLAQQADAVGPLQLGQGQAGADAVPHVLPESLVGHDEDEVVLEVAEAVVGPLVLDDVVDPGRQPLGLDGDSQRLVAHAVSRTTWARPAANCSSFVVAASTSAPGLQVE
jgi:hypothetical protein